MIQYRPITNRTKLKWSFSTMQKGIHFCSASQSKVYREVGFQEPLFLKAIPVRYTTSTLTSLKYTGYKFLRPCIRKKNYQILQIRLGLKILRTVGDVLNDVTSEVFFNYIKN